MNQADVARALMVAGLLRGAWSFDDQLYAPVSMGFIAQAAETWVRDWLPEECTEQRGIGGGKLGRFPRWVREAGDCDNIGKCFAAYLALCEWRKAADAAGPLGNLAAGFLRFVPDNAGGIGHLVNWFIDHKEIAHVFDAGAMAERHLSPAEQQSIYGGETL